MTDRAGITANIVPMYVTETPCCFERVRYPATEEPADPINVECPGCGEVGHIQFGLGDPSLAIEVVG